MEALAVTNAEQSWSSGEIAPRTAVLAAARRIARRSDIHAVSLAAVATEAGVAPASVHSCFASKNELLLAVIAGDLAGFAHEMRDVFDAPSATPFPASQKSGSVSDEQVPSVDAERVTASAAEAIARLQQTVAGLQQRPVDAWLERRLREFERALAAVEGRQSERSSIEQSLEERFRDLGKNVESLERRLLASAHDTTQRLSQSLDAAENRLRELLSETQGESAAIERRLTAIENAAFAVRPELFVAPAETVPEPAGAPESEPTSPAELASAEPIATVAAPTPYLAQARKSAQDAAKTQITRARKKSRRKSETMIYLAMGSLFLFVAMATAMGLLLRSQAMKEGTAAAEPAPAIHRIHATARNPLARLGALAQAGNPNAELLIGLSEFRSRQPANAAAAFAWLSRAAAHNQPLAQYELGLLYSDGSGVKADAQQAFHWFQSAALDGNRKAMHSLATCYAEGWGTQKDMTQAANWFARAAERGLVNDQFNLGVLYERGMGVPQNLVDAYKWYAVAASQGDREAAARIAALAPTLSPDDLAAARDAAASFRPYPISEAANEPPNPAILR